MKPVEERDMHGAEWGYSPELRREMVGRQGGERTRPARSRWLAFQGFRAGLSRSCSACACVIAR